VNGVASRGTGAARRSTAVASRTSRTVSVVNTVARISASRFIPVACSTIGSAARTLSAYSPGSSRSSAPVASLARTIAPVFALMPSATTNA
jgi:hypothetical protein